MKKNPLPCDSVWTIKRLLEWTIPYFESRGIDSPRATAEILLAYVLKIKRIDLYLQYDKPLSPTELSAYKEFIKRRVNREPLAYIIGEKGFWSLTLKVSNHVLIPRPDTECLVETVLDLLSIKKKASSQPKRILEMGIGSGAIILSIAREHHDNIYFASDISTDAINQAKLNQDLNRIDAKLNYIAGSWLEPFNTSLSLFDIIISNPPYIPASDIKTLQKEICDYEPVLALDGGIDGLDAIKFIINNSSDYLSPGGHLLLEIGYDQKEHVKEIVEKNGSYHQIVFKNDLGGNNRVVSMKKK